MAAHQIRIAEITDDERALLSILTTTERKEILLNAAREKFELLRAMNAKGNVTFSANELGDSDE